MDPETRKAVRQLVDARIENACGAIDQKLEDLFAERSAAGTLKSGETVKASLALIEGEIAAFNSTLIDDVASFAKDEEAFAMILDALDELLRRQASVVSDMMERTGAAYIADAKRATDLKWYSASKKLKVQTARHRVGFTGPKVGEKKKSASSAAPGNKNSGGKPLAKHWDGMWAEIATQLWNGDLNPETQADIKTAMFEWLNSQGIEVGDTVVTERARALWFRMERER